MKMRENKFSFFLPLVWFLVPILLMPTSRVNVVANKDDETKAYIVYLGQSKLTDIEKITKSHHEMLFSVLGSNEAVLDSMIYSYRHGFSGFAAMMTKSQAKYFEGMSGVVHVFPNHIYKVQTTRSWDFLGLEASSTHNLLHDTNQGEGAIIGVIDSGVWPESESFNDIGLGPIPSKWKGSCQPGVKFIPSKHCNKKLIGARYFIDGYRAARNMSFPNASEFLSPRDAHSHGTHCASIAAGSFVRNVSIDGLANGIARGGAPRARVAIYKSVWNGDASSVDIFKAFEEAIHDGVDVLSISFGFDIPLYPEFDKRDIIYYGSYHAVAKGITVVCATGNSGPKYQTVSNVAPWVISVAASTLDRSFPSPIILGNNRVLKTDQAIYDGKYTGFVELANWREQRDLEEPVDCGQIRGDETWLSGKMVLCFGNRKEIGVAARYIKLAGGLGLIAAIQETIIITGSDIHFPIILVTIDVGTQILNYIRFTKYPKVQLKPTKTYIGKEATTYVGYFSSRGPNSLSPAVLKPDIAAPGVNIVAAVPPTKSNPRGYEFKSGTSMAAPHIAGIAALLKILHPNWSPAAIRSAIVTTAWTSDPNSGEPIYAQGDKPRIADPFDYGGGLVNPNAAKDPGLVYDIGIKDYINYLCAKGYPRESINQFTGDVKSCPKRSNSVLALNLPSITIPKLRSPVIVQRTVTNVGNPKSKYHFVIDPPRGILVKVNPRFLIFTPRITKKSFNVTITTLHNITTEYYFGSLTWTDGVHNVKIPISVRTEFPPVFGN